jgi:hypothetical protein
MKRAMVVLAALICVVFGADVRADKVADFDDGFEAWRALPRRVGRSRQPGWKIVSNAGEKAARNSPTGSKVTYYLKLRRVFDLDGLEKPSLELKYDFRGHRYSYFRLQIGAENARRLSDFETLHEDTAKTGVKTSSFDLSGHSGKVTIQLLLRKPSKVVEKKIGLYVHRIALRSTTPLPPGECVPYDRKRYTHWIDKDRDCQDTRQESLIEASDVAATYLDERACRVAAGHWIDPYTGETFENPVYLDIDHMVPLKEAHRSGAWSWDAAKRKQFANELLAGGHLLPVKASANRQKGARDPGQWLPSNKAYHVTYAKAWIAVKRKWELTADAEELAALRAILGQDERVVYPEEAPEIRCLSD